MPIASEILLYALAALSAGILLGTLATTLVLRQRHRVARGEIHHAAELTESHLKQALSSAREALEETRRRLLETDAKVESLVACNAMLEEKSSRLPELEHHLADIGGDVFVLAHGFGEKRAG